MLLNKNKSLLTKKTGRSFLILEVIKYYKVKGKNVFHQMAAKNKNVELAEALLKPLVGFYNSEHLRTQTFITQTFKIEFFVKIS